MNFENICLFIWTLLVIIVSFLSEMYGLGILLFMIGVAIWDFFRRRCVMKGIITGKIDEKIDLPDKTLYTLNYFKTKNGNSLNPKDFSFVGYLKGRSLTKFGLFDGMKVFCDKIDENNLKRDLKRGDLIVLEIEKGINKGKLKGRMCLGFWGDPKKSDPDLIEHEGYEGTVEEYFKNVSPKKYSYPEPYGGPIEGYLKTLSCDQDGLKIKVSRPHNPKKAFAYIKHAVR